MKKKKSKKKPVKQKIDVVLESLLNLETVVKELIKRVERLQYSQPYYPNPNLPAPQSPPKHWWPNTEQPPFKFKM